MRLIEAWSKPYKQQAQRTFRPETLALYNAILDQVIECGAHGGAVAIDDATPEVISREKRFFSVAATIKGYKVNWLLGAHGRNNSAITPNEMKFTLEKAKPKKSKPKAQPQPQPQPDPTDRKPFQERIVTKNEIAREPAIAGFRAY
jgi:hypothetical protein